MVLSFFLPVDGADLLTLCRVYCFLTAVALSMGRPLVGAAFAGWAMYILQDNAYHAKSRNDGEVLDMWMLLCSFSAIASFGSWFLLFLSTIQSDPSQSYRTYFFGYALQKLWALGVGYVLYQDLRLLLDVPGIRRTESMTSLASDEGRGPPGRILIGGNGGSSGDASALTPVLYELRVRVIQGKGLVPKDARFMFGKNVISDP